MFRLAAKTLKTDFLRMLKCHEIIFFLLVLITPWVYAYVENLRLVFWSITYINVFILRRFQPECGRIHFVIPISEADRKKIMLYRTLIAEGMLLIYSIACLLAVYWISGLEYSLNMLKIIIVIMGWYMGLEVIYFSHYKDLKETEKKDLRALFPMMIIYMGAIGLLLGEEKGLLFAATGIVIVLINKWHFIYYSRFDKYRLKLFTKFEKNKMEEKEWF